MTDCKRPLAALHICLVAVELQDAGAGRGGNSLHFLTGGNQGEILGTDGPTARPVLMVLAEIFVGR